MSLFKIYDPIEDVIARVNSGGGGGGVPSTGGTFTGDIIMAPPAKITQTEYPSGPSDLVNLGYLQSYYLPLAGGTLTGNLGMNGTTEVIQATLPSTPSSLANRQYVDNQIANATIPDATTLVKGKIKLAGDLTGTADVPEVANLAITNAKMANLTANSQLKGSSNTSTNVTDISLGPNLIMNGTTLDINLSNVPTVPVPISQGGTGTTSIPGRYVTSDGTIFSSVASIPVEDVDGAVLTVNGTGPNGSGNVVTMLSNVDTGPFANLPAQPVNEGNIYVVSGDPDTNLNGHTYISDGSTWLVITSDFPQLDQRYLKKTNDTFTAGNTLNFPATSNLTIDDDAVNGTDVMNLNSFNNTTAGDSRFGVVKFDPTSDLADLGGPTANSGIAVVRAGSIGAAKLNLGGTSRVFGSNNASSTVVELTMGSGLEITGSGVLQTNLSSGSITNNLTSGSNNIVSTVANNPATLTIGTSNMEQVVGLDASGSLVRANVGSVPTSNSLTSNLNNITSNVNGCNAVLTIGTNAMCQVVGLDASGSLVRANVSSIPTSNTLTSGSNTINSTVNGCNAVLTIGTSNMEQVVGLDASGSLVRANVSSIPTSNMLTSVANTINSTVNGNNAVLTIGTNNMCQVVGLDASGSLVRANVSSIPTSNSLTSNLNNITSNVNGNNAVLTIGTNNMCQVVGLDASGSLVRANVSSIPTSNSLTSGSNNIISNVNGCIATLTANPDTISRFLGFNNAGSLVYSLPTGTLLYKYTTTDLFFNDTANPVVSTNIPELTIPINAGQRVRLSYILRGYTDAGAFTMNFNFPDYSGSTVWTGMMITPIYYASSGFKESNIGDYTDSSGTVIDVNIDWGAAGVHMVKIEGEVFNNGGSTVNWRINVTASGPGSHNRQIKANSSVVYAYF